MKKLWIICTVLLAGILFACERDPDLNEIIEQSMVVIDGAGIPEAAEYNPDSGNIHPIVIIHSNGKHKRWNYDLPQEWRPSDIYQLELVAIVNNPVEGNVIDECCYGWLCSGGYVRTIQMNTTVIIRAAKTGALIAEKIYTKNPSSGCPGSITSPYNIYAKDLEVSETTDWLSGFVYGTIDLSKPVITIISPIESSTVSGEIEIKVKVTDNKGVKVVKFDYRSASVSDYNITLGEANMPAYNKEYIILWDTKSCEDGKVFIRATAYDDSDNSIEAEWSFYVKNQAEDPESFPKVSAQLSQTGDTWAGINGSVSDEGDSPVTSCGVCWNTTGNPAINDQKITTIPSGTGYFECYLSGLQSNTSYYSRAYAVNSQGIGYGEIIQFTTVNCEPVETGTFTDSRDQTIYKWTKICGQTWMAENLAYLPEVYPSSGNSETEKRYYVYGYEGTDISLARTTTNYSDYGVLYNWPAAMNGESGSDAIPSGVQGVCPSGWHLPGKSEWEILASILGPYAGGKMKETGLVHWNSPNNGATNESQFSGLPGGILLSGNDFWKLGSAAYYASTTVCDLYCDTTICGEGFYTPFLINNSASFGLPACNSKSTAVSVRCIKDD